MYKQVIIVRKDLNMPKGKLATQVAHASVDSLLESDHKKVELWKKEGMKKVVVKVDDEKELMKYFRMAKDIKLKTVIIKDAGKTFFKGATVTCIGIGPDEEDKIDKVTKELKMV